jgi:glyoxylase I family protein
VAAISAKRASPQSDAARGIYSPPFGSNNMGAEPERILTMTRPRESSSPTRPTGATHETWSHLQTAKGDALGFHGVRYQVKDVGRSVAFYVEQLGFKLEHEQLPAFANVSLGELRLLLSGPGASGSRPMPDGARQEPGGWNRVVLRVTNLPARIEGLRKANLRFRNEMEVGPGGKQIQIEDPDGNPIELFEPAH